MMSSRFESEYALMLRQVSSANNLGSEDVLLTISFMYIKNNNGPSVEL